MAVGLIVVVTVFLGVLVGTLVWVGVLASVVDGGASVAVGVCKIVAITAFVGVDMVGVAMLPLVVTFGVLVAGVPIVVAVNKILSANCVVVLVTDGALLSGVCLGDVESTVAECSGNRDGAEVAGVSLLFSPFKKIIMKKKNNTTMAPIPSHKNRVGLFLETVMVVAVAVAVDNSLKHAGQKVDVIGNISPQCGQCLVSIKSSKLVFVFF